MNELLSLLPVVNVLLVPALVYVVRIDRRMGQLDTLQGVDAANIAKLENKTDLLNQRVTRLEFQQ